MNDSYEFEAKSVEDAVEEGLAQLGLRQDQVDIEVVRKGSRGILGFGSEQARVRISPRAAGTSAPLPGTATDDASQNDSADAELLEADEALTLHVEDVESSDAIVDVAEALEQENTSSAAGAAEEDASVAHSESQSEEEGSAKESDDKGESSATAQADEQFDEEGLAELAADFLADMLGLMEFDAQVEASWKEPEPDEDEACLMLDVYGDDLNALIGRRGETLADIQYLLRLMVNQRVRAWKNIVVDVDGYKARRADQLRQLAERMADQVQDSGRAMSLEPMPSNERRVIHLSLRNNEHVYTESSGEGDRRKVHIIPRRMLD